jgi:hypothetical protein
MALNALVAGSISTDRNFAKKPTDNERSCSTTSASSLSTFTFSVLAFGKMPAKSLVGKTLRLQLRQSSFTHVTLLFINLRQALLAALMCQRQSQPRRRMMHRKSSGSCFPIARRSCRQEMPQESMGANSIVDDAASKGLSGGAHARTMFVFVNRARRSLCARQRSQSRDPRFERTNITVVRSTTITYHVSRIAVLAGARRTAALRAVRLCVNLLVALAPTKNNPLTSKQSSDLMKTH